MATIHPYLVAVDWQGGRDGGGKLTATQSSTQVPLAVPVEFQGVGGGSNPEELLTGAIASCYSMTFGIIAANRKIPVASFHAEAIGEVEQTGAALVYKKITVKPSIVLTSDATEEQVKLAEDMAHKADGYCLVTNAVRGKVEIVVEPTISKE